MKAHTIGIRVITLLAAATFLIVGCSKPPTPTTWASSASMVIESGVSIGPIHSGMTMQQVVAELGEPEKKEEVLRYPHLGFRVLPVKKGLVGAVICGDAARNGPGTTSFAGHTKEGIGIGSSRDDVIKAYGEPTTIEPILGRPGSELLRYKPLGLDFKIENGKVYVMAVFFKNAE